MLDLLMSNDRKEVELLRRRILLQRWQVKAMTEELHIQVDQKLRSPWALPSSFAAGYVFSMMGKGATRFLISVIPFSKLAFAAATSAMR